MHGQLDADDVLTGKKISDYLSYRGPDEKGSFFDSDCFLASNRFSITGVSNGKMPISNESSQIQVILNGEIYNYKDLREELIQKGHRFKTLGDTEVLVHLYEEKKEYFLKDLRGMFAFALYDKTDPNNPKLILARDRFGEKPLFYAKNGNKVYFASESNALLDVTKKKICKNGLAQYLAFGFSFDHIIKGIKRVRSGTYVVITKKRIAIKTYWNPKFNTNYQIPYAEAVDTVSNLLKEATQQMLPQEVNYGLFLSGGVDSATVGMQMLAIDPKIDAISSGLVGLTEKIDLSHQNSDFLHVEETGNEFQYAESFVSSSEKISLQKKEFSPAEFLENLEEMIMHLPGGPSISTSFPIWYYAGKKAHSNNIRSVLAGEGADELFGGYESNNPYRYEGRSDITVRYSEVMGWLNQEELRGLIKGKFHDPFWQAQKEIDKKFRGTGKKEDLEFNKLRFMVGHGLVIAPHMLERADGMTMMHPVEVRLPFLYPPLADFLYTLPKSFFVSKGTTKRLLRSVAEKLHVPDTIIRRPKQRTSLPYLKLFYRNSRYAERFQRIVTCENAVLKKYLDPKKVNELVKNSERNPRRLLGLIILELYLKEIFKK